jgi:hypothetical protein
MATKASLSNQPNKEINNYKSRQIIINWKIKTPNIFLKPVKMYEILEYNFK